MKIVAVKNGSLLTVVLDDQTSFRISKDLFLEQKILVGQDYSQKQINHFKNLALIESYYYKCLNLLSFRQRSQLELINYLKKFKLKTNQINQIIEKLSYNGYLQENKFLKSYIHDSLYLNFKSKRKIRYELIKKGFSAQQLESVLSQFSDQETLINLIKKKQKMTKYTDQKKLINYLINQGFDYEDIKIILAKQVDRNG